MGHDVEDVAGKKDNEQICDWNLKNTQVDNKSSSHGCTVFMQLCIFWGEGDVQIV
jgi:hypothetical protein